MTKYGRLAAVASTLLACARAHIIMQKPVPFSSPYADNSPLVNIAIGAATSDFPCKLHQGGSYVSASITNMTVGQPQDLTFTGSATHNGGTCELAITMDVAPTPASVWKIIQVYEGGCPIKNDASGQATSAYTFTIPNGFPNAEQATFAWVWYNRVGNREIYMNCAPISIDGGSDSSDFFNTLPNLYVINLPASGPDACVSADNKDVKVPNPGKFVTKGGSDAAVAPSGGGCAAAAAAQTQTQSSQPYTGGSGNATSANSTSPSYGSATSDPVSSPTYGASAVSSPAESDMTMGPSASYATMTSIVSSSSSLIIVPTTPASSSHSTDSSAIGNDSTSFPTLTIYSSGEGVFGPGSTAGSGAVATASPTSTGSATASPPVSYYSPAISTEAATASSAVPYTTASPSSTSGDSSTCSTEGAIVCNGADQFGLCNHGEVIWQAVAGGTTCTNGMIEKRDKIAEGSLEMLHVRRHARQGWRQGAQGLRVGFGGTGGAA